MTANFRSGLVPIKACAAVYRTGKFSIFAPFRKTATRLCGNSSRHEAGFSLLELLVSLALLALILVAMPSLLRLGERAREASEDLDRSGAPGAALAFMEQRLAQAMPGYERNADGRLTVTFRGRPDNVSFVAPSALGPAGGGLYRFELRANAEVDGARALALRWSLYRPSTAEADASPPTQERILVANIAGLGLRYFGRPKPDAEPAWFDEWTRTDLLPDLVELRVAAPPGPRAPSPLVLRVELKLRTGQ